MVHTPPLLLKSPLDSLVRHPNTWFGSRLALFVDTGTRPSFLLLQLGFWWSQAQDRVYFLTCRWSVRVCEAKMNQQAHVSSPSPPLELRVQFDRWLPSAEGSSLPVFPYAGSPSRCVSSFRAQLYAWAQRTVRISESFRVESCQWSYVLLSPKIQVHCCFYFISDQQLIRYFIGLDLCVNNPLFKTERFLFRCPWVRILAELKDGAKSDVISSVWLVGKEILEEYLQLGL